MEAQIPPQTSLPAVSFLPDDNVSVIVERYHYRTTITIRSVASALMLSSWSNRNSSHFPLFLQHYANAAISVVIILTKISELGTAAQLQMIEV